MRNRCRERLDEKITNRDNKTERKIKRAGNKRKRESVSVDDR